MKKEWLQLIQAKGVPLRAKRELVRALGDPGAVLGASAQTIADVLHQAGIKLRGKQTPRLRFPTEVGQDLEALARVGGEFIAFNEVDFPPLLGQIRSAPLGLFYVGNRELLCKPQLAVVGSRNPTPSGKRTTAQLCAELAQHGLAITSGLALGIDLAAHCGCLEADGDTIAVLATGIDVIYPHANRELRAQIVARGLLVTEYCPGTPPKREHFPARNRIISGLTLGTLVVEAGIPSGSLITARLAGEQGREVFAVPGSIHVPVSRGCHQLLRQGAKLVESSADILEEIGQFSDSSATAEDFRTAQETTHGVAGIMGARPLSPEHEKLYALIDYTPVSIDQLITRSGLTADQVSYILMQLEFEQRIAICGGGYQRLPESQASP